MVRARLDSIEGPIAEVTVFGGAALKPNLVPATLLSVGLTFALPSIAQASAAASLTDSFGGTSIDGTKRTTFQSQGIVSESGGRLNLVPTAKAVSSSVFVESSSADSLSAKVRLGSALFFDKRLSSDGTVSCATCHQPEKAFTDGKRVAIGVGGRAGTRNTPTLVNVGASTSFFWDGRRSSLEAQIGDPFVAPNEHALSDHGTLLEVVRSDPSYEERYALAFGKSARVTLKKIEEAIAVYLRTLVAGDSPFDRYYYGGETRALSESQRRGFLLFRDRGQCANCHLIATGRAMFTDNGFHRSQLPASVARDLPQLTSLVINAPEPLRFGLISSRSDIAALGRFVATLDPRDIGSFKTPTLRNVALTAPYLHDGSAATLAEAIDRELYSHSSSSEKQLILTPSEQSDLVAFLQSLTSDSLAASRSEPSSPPMR